MPLVKILLDAHGALQELSRLLATPLRMLRNSQVASLLAALSMLKRLSQMR